MSARARALIPLAAAGLIAIMPAPAGMEQHGWYYFAIFSGVVLGLILEPLPPAAIGLVGITAVSVLARWTLFSPTELTAPGFDPATRSIGWALSGFANLTIWLSFAACMFATGYQKTGLGRRIALSLVHSLGRRTLTLGYRCRACSPHAFQHGAQRRHRISDHPQPAAALRLPSPHGVGPAHRQLHHVDGIGHDLGD